jgi:glucosamine--fructose-6-phosphate aminotransferase (isomerizing)
VISQSGETADTLAAMREAQRKGARAFGIVNVVGSTIARESNAGVYIHAGPEIGVASTKAFTSQVTVLALVTLALGRQREMSLETGIEITRELEMIPGKIEKILCRATAVPARRAAPARQQLPLPRARGEFPRRRSRPASSRTSRTSTPRVIRPPR